MQTYIQHHARSQTKTELHVCEVVNAIDPVIKMIVVMCHQEC